MNIYHIIVWALRVLLLASASGTLIAGWNASKDCSSVPECDDAAKMLIAAAWFYIFALLTFTRATHADCTGFWYIPSIIFFIIASVLYGVGAEKAGNCTGDCRSKSLDTLLASNALFIVSAFATAWVLPHAETTPLSYFK